MTRKVKLRIWRGDSKNGDFKDVTVDANEGEVVLDVIHRVQATQMSDLAVRWNCKAGKCGSCSMEINGKPQSSKIWLLMFLITTRKLWKFQHSKAQAT